MNPSSVDDLEEDRLYAGLAVVAREYQDLLQESNRSDAAAFLSIFNRLEPEWPSTYPRYYLEEYLGERGQRTAALYAQSLVASAHSLTAASAQLPLIDSSMVHEYILFPGKELFAKFQAQWKITICGKDGPYEKFKDGLLGQSGLPAALTATILATGFGAAVFWYPLAVYIAFLLIKTGLATYCEPELS